MSTEATAVEIEIKPKESTVLGGSLSPKRVTRKIDLADLTIILIALILRLVDLGMKPAHFDEGINGWFVDRMRSAGFYDYDPAGYHGPFYFYLLFVSLSLFGRDLIALRLPAVLGSTLCVVAMLGFRNVFSKRVCQFAALCMAVSPAFVFYGRYSIHENWLVLSLLVTTWGFLTLWKGSRRGLWALGLGLAGMVLVKETYVIHAGCIGLAWLVLRFLEKSSPSDPPDPFAWRTWSMDDLVAVAAVSIALILFFYSGTFLNWPAVWGLILTYGEWFSTGWKGDHSKPFEYFLDLTAKFELPALLGVVAGTRYIFRSERKPRYLAIYGAGAFCAYSIIAYKTPWCILAILWPFYFLLGTVLEEMTTRNRWFGLLWIVPGVSLAFSAWETIDLNFRRYVDETHPYVYVQTFPEIREVTGPLEALRRSNPEGVHISGNIMMESSFPLPWLLGEFDQFGFYPKKGKQPPTVDVAFLIVDDNRVREIEPGLKSRYFTGQVKIRPGVSGKFYLREKEFGVVFPGRKPDFEPRAEGEIEIRKALPVN